MSELTRIAAILFKNLSDALLTSASEISKLDNPESTAKIFTQADESQPILPPEKPKLITCYQYSPNQKVLVVFDGAMSPVKCRILRRVDSESYLVYPQRTLKSLAEQIHHSQILGLDPDR